MKTPDTVKILNTETNRIEDVTVDYIWDCVRESGNEHYFIERSGGSITKAKRYCAWIFDMKYHDLEITDKGAIRLAKKWKVEDILEEELLQRL